SGKPELPLFVDGTTLITGAITVASSQTIGLAGRIAVNAAVVADPAKLVLYASGTLAGDATRPNFLYGQLTQASLAIGDGSNATQATLPSFLRQALVQQGQDAAAAASLREGQQVVVDALRQRLTETSGVSIDQEMTTLLALQSAYSANARVLSAVRDMLET